MTPTDIARAKNMDLLVHSYNQEAKAINRSGFFCKDDKYIKELRNKYDAIIARLDTDKTVNKGKDSYVAGISMDSNKVIGVKGITSTVKIRGK